jgi:hypothetical protein
MPVLFVLVLVVLLAILERTSALRALTSSSNVIIRFSGVAIGPRRRDARDTYRKRQLAVAWTISCSSTHGRMEIGTSTNRCRSILPTLKVLRARHANGSAI